MKPFITLSLSALFALNAFALTKQTEASSLNEMFTKAESSAELRLLYSNIDETNGQDSYATAVGGALTYRLAPLQGFGGGVTLRTTNDIDALTGNGNRYDPNLSTQDGTYSELTQAYLEYQQNNFSLRAGRQILDTPLADSDDMRMVPNTFEAIVASYNIKEITFVAADVIRWQGFDAGLEDSWSKTGEDGTYTAAILYENNGFNLAVWYYDVTKIASAYYIETSQTLNYANRVDFTLSLQYLNENEKDNSAVEASIYGVMAEISSEGITASFAYNSSARQKEKTSFSGFGGGTLFTSMDTMILDEITEDADAQAYLATLTYEIQKYTLFYAYGDFSTTQNSVVAKKDITEQNIGAEYTPTDDLTLSAIYVIDENQEDSNSDEFNFTNFRLFATYNF